MELQQSECRAWAQVERLKTALDEHNLELRVKAANEAEAACQQRLTAAEADIAELRQQLDDSERLETCSDCAVGVSFCDDLFTYLEMCEDEARFRLIKCSGFGGLPSLGEPMLFVVRGVIIFRPTFVVSVDVALLKRLFWPLMSFSRVAMELRESLKAKNEEGDAYISEIEVTYRVLLVRYRTEKLDMPMTFYAVHHTFFDKLHSNVYSFGTFCIAEQFNEKKPLKKFKHSKFIF